MRNALARAGGAIQAESLRFAAWMSRNYKWVLPTVILVLLLPILGGVALTLSTISEQQNEIKAQQAVINEQQAVIVRVQKEQVGAAFDTCERGNESREVNVGNLRNDVHTLVTTLALWEAALATSGTGEAPPEVVAAFNGYLDGLRLGIQHKRRTIRRTIETQAPVAIEPGSPVDDCQRVVRAPSPGGSR
jgi:hypothetical protein